VASELVLAELLAEGLPFTANMYVSPVVNPLTLYEVTVPLRVKAALIPS